MFEAFWLLGRENRFSCGNPCGQQGGLGKCEVRERDGIPKFWRHEKICGRLPESPPTESEAALDVPPVRSTCARENGPDQEEQNEQSTIEKDFSVRNGTDVFRLDYKEKQ